MITPFERAWLRTGRVEAGYVNHPSDPGGETNHGVTVRVARAHGYTGPMSELPLAVAVRIAKEEYWDAIRGDALTAVSEPVAQEVFDTHFNLWPGAAGRFLQESLNSLNRQARDYPDLKVDGDIGPATLAALGAYFARRRADDGELVLLRVLNSLQGAEYVRQAKVNTAKEDFVFGWFRHRVAI